MTRRGFTLIEVLVVVALVVVFAGGLGLAWRGSGRAVGLQTGQATLAGLVAAARGTAATTGRNAAVLALAHSALPGEGLRRLVVAGRNADDTAWVPVDDWVELPAGVALLPPQVPAGAATRVGDDWTGLRSHALSTATELCDDVPCHVLAFTPRGTVMGLGGALIVAPATALPAGEGAPLRYEQPEAVRGIIVSSYGQIIAVETRSGF
jgi:prepilin-type N-terminal cleavage/methylation domain-containing protein